MPSQKRPAAPASALRKELPRILVRLGILFMILGVVVTIGFVAGDSSCNAATTLGATAAAAPSNGFCGHANGFLAAGFVILVVGAALLIAGSMVIPTLRQRDARLEEAKRSEEATEES